MQYTVIVNQLKAMEWELNPAQSALMAFIYELEAWGDDVVKDDFAYKWISKQKVVDELPLFFAKPDTVHRNLIELEKKGLIVRNFTTKLSLVKITHRGRQWRIKVGNKSEVGSDLNPSMVGFRSEVGSDLNPTDHSTNIIGTNIRYSLSENKFSDDDMKLASWMLKRVQMVAPRAQADLDKWADVIRLMRERDGLSHQHITNVFRLVNQDNFWKANILSPTKLRDKFPQLEAKFLPQLPKQSITDPEKSKSNQIAKLDSEINAIENDLKLRRTLDQTVHGPYVQSMEKKLAELKSQKEKLTQ